MSKPKQKDVTEESKAYFAAGDTESALRSLREALKRTPTNVALLDYATWLCWTLNVDSEAVDAFDSIVCIVQTFRSTKLPPQRPTWKTARNGKSLGLCT